VAKLSAANTSTAQVEGDTIAAGSEFAAVQFIAGATGASTDTIAHAAILTISAVPDVLAVLLLLAAGYKSATPVVESEPVAVRRSRSKAAQKGWTTRKRKALISASGKPLTQVK
jgi:hypothetical protein